MSAEIKLSTHLSSSYLIKVAREIYPSKSISSLYKQLIFCIKARKNRDLIEAFSTEIHQLGYNHIFKQEPNVLGNLVWPYIHKDWDATQRFSCIAGHYTLLKNMPKFLDVSDGSAKEIVNLDTFSPDTSIVLDKPRWFVREGEIVLNIFHEGLRVMSVVFCLSHDNQELILYVGGIQGIHSGIPSEKSLEIIKQMTKDFNGLRPRSFVIAVLRMIATRIGATKILAIDQTHRHHWHPYFKSATKSVSKTNYDEIWKDNDGIAFKDGFYQLKVNTTNKDLSEVDSKKRSMYRKRYEMLDQIDQQISVLA
ncbi:MAG TPA: DUF535 family protein [Methylotenera sp.]|nr:DUF535 family protein [Methylotenera sp.]